MKPTRKLSSLRVTALVSMSAIVACGLGIDLALLMRSNPEGPAILGLLLFALSAVVFLVWTHRAAANVLALGRELRGFTPASCVGWWFVPFANIVKPSLALQEIWRRSRPESAAEERQPPAPVQAVGKWWLAFVLSGFLGQLSILMRERELSALVGLAGTAFSMVAVYWLAKVMIGIEEGQADASERLQSSESGEPLWEYRERGTEGDGVPITPDGLRKLCERDPQGMAAFEFRAPGRLPWRGVAASSIQASRSRLRECVLVVCRSCRAHLELRRVDDVPGRRARCNRCGAGFVLTGGRGPAPRATGSSEGRAAVTLPAKVTATGPSSQA